MEILLFRVCLLAHLASCLYMVGVIWFVQVVHYPLFASTASAEFSVYERRHAALTFWVVAPPMLIEGATAILLLWLLPAGVFSSFLWMGLALLGVIWFSTAYLQIPCHNLLSQRFDTAVHQRLVATNWLRTVAWSLRGVLVLYIAGSSLS